MFKTKRNLGVVTQEADALTVNDSTTIGTGGTAIGTLLYGQGTVANGQTSIAVTVTGVTTSARVFATITGTNTNGVSIEKAVPTADTITVTVTGDPGADTTVDVLAILPAS